jgi:beta-glucosidase-like glycosyl hydrolase
MRKLACILGAIVMASGSSGRAQFRLTPTQQAWVDRTLAQMTLDEKIGQVMFAVSPAVFTNQTSEAFRQIKDNIQKYHVGGYHLEVGDPLAAYALVSRMRELARVPLLITADFEGGAGIQFRGATRFPRAMALAATGNPQYAYDAANLVAREAKAMGIGVNFYPDVDVNNNPLNPIINIRSFGESPQLVGEFAAAYIKGTQDAFIVATAKHFPGHGDTSVDSHLLMPTIDFDRARLDLVELPPFRQAIRSGVGAVMTAHLHLSQFDKTPGLPASLSSALTTDLLRKELGFQGLIFTDALPMHAITTHFGAEQAVVMAIWAGADVALEPLDVAKSFEALKAAVGKNEITVERLNESVRRLLAAKAWVGLSAQRVPDLSQVDNLVGSQATLTKAQEIIEHALTLVKDDRNVLPLKLSDDEDVLLVNLVDAANPEYTETAGLAFRDEFVKRHAKTFFASVTPLTSRTEADLVRRLALRYHTVVVCASIRMASYKGSLSLNEAQLGLLRDLVRQDAAERGRFVFALFGSPYLLNTVPELPSYALAYEFYPGAEAAMVRAILGEIKFQGRLPVTVGDFPAGSGLKR